MQVGRGYQAEVLELPRPTPSERSKGLPRLAILLGLLRGCVKAQVAKEQVETAAEIADTPMKEKVQEALVTHKRLNAFDEPDCAGEAMGFFRVLPIRGEGYRNIHRQTFDIAVEKFLKWHVFAHCEGKKAKGSAPKGNLERFISQRIQEKGR